MIKLRHPQPSLWNRGLAEDIEDLWEPWMRLVDDLPEDEQLLDTVLLVPTVKSVPFFYTFDDSGKRLVHGVEICPLLNLETKVFLFVFIGLVSL